MWFRVGDTCLTKKKKKGAQSQVIMSDVDQIKVTMIREKAKIKRVNLKNPVTHRLLPTYSEFPRGETTDDPKWTNDISRGIMVVCDVKVTLRGLRPGSEASGWAGQRAGCINTSRICFP